MKLIRSFFLICLIPFFCLSCENIKCAYDDICSYCAEWKEKAFENFILAIKNGDKDTAKFYLNTYHSFINEHNKDGRSALYYAVDSGNESLTSFLIDNGADVNMINYIMGGEGVFDDEDIYITGTVLHRAILNKNLSMVKLLIARGADPNKRHIVTEHSLERTPDGYSPLHCAVLAGSVEIAGFLVEKGADPGMKNAAEETPLDCAVRKPNNRAMVICLLSRINGINLIKDDNYTPLFYKSVCSGDIEIVKFFISHGMSVNVIDSVGKTPVHYACEHGQADIAVFFIKHGARLDISDDYGRTPFHEAVWADNFSLVKLLADRGASINGKDKSGNTPLHMAGDNEKIIEFLISRGANINARNNDGDTPLHVFACHNRVRAVKILLSKGASSHCKNKEGKTPLDIAVEHGYKDMVKFFYY